jgi:hypothetical protein
MAAELTRQGRNCFPHARIFGSAGPFLSEKKRWKNQPVLCLTPLVLAGAVFKKPT